MKLRTAASKIIFLCLPIMVFSCKSLYNSEYIRPSLVDEKLNRNARKVHKKLVYISKKGFAIGHQDATTYGIGWHSKDTENTVQSDVFELIGDNPAVYGFDIGRLEIERPFNLDSVSFEAMRHEIINVHKKGGVITLSWHLDNPVTGGNSWDEASAVNSIFTDKAIEKKFDTWLNRVASFIKSLKYKGKAIPILFRPYHEMNGFWFWWGDPNCNAIDYVRLWRKTVRTLRDEHKLHNLLYVYSPNKLNPDDDYMKYYPGDNYVDILGIDIYDFSNKEDYLESVINDLKLVKQLATTKGKLFAFTETGQEKITTKNWFSEVLYPNIKDSGIAWVLFWRNANLGHFYIPFKEHANAEDFKIFANHPETFFLKDLRDLED